MAAHGDWRRLWDDKQQHHYWYNEQTHESRWEDASNRESTGRKETYEGAVPSVRQQTGHSTSGGAYTSSEDEGYNDPRERGAYVLQSSSSSSLSSSASAPPPLLPVSSRGHKRRLRYKLIMAETWTAVEW